MHNLESEFSNLKNTEKIMISLEFLKELKDIWKNKIEDLKYEN